MRNIYGEDLRCDFFQVPHHGYGPNDAGFLSQTKPKWLLWPVAQNSYGGSSVAHLQLFFAADTTVREIYVSAFTNYIFALPFDGTNVTAVQNEKFQ